MRNCLVILPLLAIAVASCGGSSATPNFAGAANAICARADGQIEALVPSTNTPKAEARLLRKAFAIAQVEYDRLSRLTAPGKQESLFVSGLQEQTHLLALGRGESAALNHGEVSAAYKLLDRSNRYAAANDLAMSALGLKACAANPQPRGQP
jgi:hypothetical protein